MVEVFKTNVSDREQANKLLRELHKKFDWYKANFDLNDRDKILRVECNAGFILSWPIIKLVKNCGFEAEVLPDPEPLKQTF